MPVESDSHSRFLGGRVESLTSLELTQAVEFVRGQLGGENPRVADLERELEKRPLYLNDTPESVWNR